MILTKKPPYLDTRARMLMAADPKMFRSIHVRNCAGKRQCENIFSGHFCVLSILVINWSDWDGLDNWDDWKD